MKRPLQIYLFIFILFGACQSQEKQDDREVDELESPKQDTLTLINKKWEGTWEREGSIDAATLDISNVTFSSFNFHLSTHDGLTASEFSGKAIVDENMGLYISTHNSDTCQMNFILQDSLILLKQDNNRCSEASGLDFSGEYFEERYFKEKVMEEDAANRKSIK